MIDAETGEELSRGVVPDVVRRRAGHAARGRSPAASSGCRACSIVQRLDRGRAPRQGEAQRHPARPRRRARDRRRRAVLEHRRRRPVRAHRRARRGPVGEPPRGRARRPRRGAAARARAVARASTASAPTSIARTAARARPAGRARRPPRHRARQRQRRCRASRATSLHGLGSADMKGGLAVLLAPRRGAARRPGAARHDVTLVFYEGEEVADEFNGLRHAVRRAPELVAGDLAVLLEPTDGWVEAGCQGVLVLAAALRRRARAHGPAVDGPQRDPPRRRRARPGSPRTRPTPSTSTGSSTASRCRSCGIEGGHRRQDNVVPDRCTIVVEPPLRAVLHARRGGGAGARAARGRRRRRGAAVRSRRRRRTSRNPLVAEFVDGLDLPVRPEARAGPTSRASRRTGDPGGQLRPRRSRDRAHRGRARRPRESLDALPTRVARSRFVGVA